MILISACLAGINCKYNGENNADLGITELLQTGKALPVCPEVLGGLEIPRPACEQVNKLDGTHHIMTIDGTDVTEAFEHGAHRTLAICKAADITEAILQERSPSCGKDQIYDGTFSGKLIQGNGRAAQVLLDHGIKVYTKDEWVSKGKNNA
jgi:uncharacterized protein YbbK (DUF523 family)